MVGVCVLTGYGINADLELIEAFRRSGGQPEGVHVADLVAEPDRIADFRIVALPGGFSFGDHLGSGRVLAALLRGTILDRLRRHVDGGGLVIGICNGFQVLVELGLLPCLEGKPCRQASLIHNDSGRFVDRWVTVERENGNDSPWLGSLSRLDVPIRHGEGRFVCDEDVLRRITTGNQVAFRYVGENPNGSLSAIAGITDGSGRILGLMPHPEAYLTAENHPSWTRGGAREPLGTALLRNGVAFAEAAR